MRRLPCFGKGDDVTVAVVDLRRAYFYAKTADDTNIELPDYFDARTRRGSMASSSGACMKRASLPGRQRELEASIEEADLKIGETSKCTFRSGCGKLVGTMHGDDVLMSGPRSIVEKVQKSLKNGTSHGSR